MKYSYLLGVGFGAVAVACMLLFLCIDTDGPRDVLLETRVIVDDGRVPFIIHGEKRSVSLLFRGATGDQVTISSIRFSKPWVELTKESAAALPLVLHRDEEARLEASLSPVGPESGLVTVGCSIDVERGAARISLLQHMQIECVGRVNAEPAGLAFGDMADSDESQSMHVALWHPTGVQTPAIISISSDDPAVSAIFQPDLSSGIRGGRHYFGNVIVTVEPKLLSTSLRSTVFVRSTSADVSIRCYAWGLAHDGP